MKNKARSVLLVFGVSLATAAAFAGGVAILLELRNGGNLQEKRFVTNGDYFFLRMLVTSFLVSLSIAIPAAVMFRKDTLPAVIRGLVPIGAGAVTAVTVRLAVLMLREKADSVGSVISNESEQFRLNPGPLLLKIGAVMAALLICWVGVILRQKQLAARLNRRIQEMEAGE